MRVEGWVVVAWGRRDGEKEGEHGSDSKGSDEDSEKEWRQVSEQKNAGVGKG